MAAVAAGGDRQELHERIRRHSQAAAAVVKEQGGQNDLLERLAADPAFGRVDLAADAASRGSSSAAPRSRSTSFWPRWSSRSRALSRGGPRRRGSQGVVRQALFELRDARCSHDAPTSPASTFFPRQSAQTPVMNMRWPTTSKTELPGDLVADSAPTRRCETRSAGCRPGNRGGRGWDSRTGARRWPGRRRDHLVEHARLDQLAQRAIDGGPAELAAGRSGPGGAPSTRRRRSGRDG